MRTLVSARRLAALAFLVAVSLRAEGPPSLKLAAHKGRPEVPSDFGDRISILQIPAAAFTPRCSGITTEYESNGYIRVAGDNGCSSFNGQLQAAVYLPTGVNVHFLDLYGQDNEPSDDLSAILRGYKGGFDNDDAYNDIVGVTTEGVTGRQYTFSDQVDYTVDNNVAYGDGVALTVLIFAEAGLDVGFKGVDIWWSRQVSPAPAVATFNDVPTGHPFFQYIEALYDSGVTGGCSAAPPLYCPDNYVTRGQMAVFLAKALGLAWFDSAGLF
jgi:S-layer homology domain